MPPPDQDAATTTAAGSSDAAARLLAALLAAAEKQGVSALIETVKPPVTVVNLPELKAGVVVLERGDVDAATLAQRLNHLTEVPTRAVIHLLLVGGGPADRALVEQADRNAHNRNRLGVWHLDDGGQLTHVAGRKLSLLPAAGKLFLTASPLTPEAIASAAGRAQRAQEEAIAFGQELQSRRPITTWTLLGVNALMFLLATTWGRASSFLEAELLMGANNRELIAAGQYWRLLAHAFLHGSITHLIVNGISLFSLGGLLERVLGWRRFIVLYTASALAGGLASAFVGNAELTVGASGAIFGLLGATFGLVRPGVQVLPQLMSRTMRRQLVPMVIINVAISFHPMIDKYAHFGGGLMGFGLVAFWLSRDLPAAGRPPGAPDAWPLRVVAGLSVALMLASVALALITGKPWHPQGLSTPDSI